MDAGLPIPRLPASAERLLLPAAALLWLERAWARHLKWVAVAWTIWLALSLMGLAEAIPGELRVGLLFGLALGSLGALVVSFRDVELPGRAEALRRLEQASGSRRGSLALLDERAVDLSDPTTALLWARARAEATPAKLRLGRPRLAIDEAERYALLPLLAIGLFFGALIARDEAPARIAAGFSPYAVSLADLRVTATIAPPPYAGSAPRTLNFGPGDQPITALKGSRLTLRIAAPAGDWLLVGPGGALPVKDGRVAVTLAAEGRYVLRLGKRQAVRIDVSFAADAVPSIVYAGRIA